MLKFQEWTGINNVQPQERLTDTDLVRAVNVVVGLSREVKRRDGFSRVSADCHKNLHQADGFMLATKGSVLTAIHPGPVEHVIHPALGYGRVWYTNLPDGRTVYSNGLIQGITEGLTGIELAVPAPQSLGTLDYQAGGLPKGKYIYGLSYVRLADRVEGPTITSQRVDINEGGMYLAGLPQRDGYSINIYLSGLDGERVYLIGNTAGSLFIFTGADSNKSLYSKTVGLQPMPVGSISAFWRGRLLVAQGNVLMASRPNTVHIAAWRDFNQMADPITMLIPMDDGIFVGTEKHLVWLAGTEWGALAYRQRIAGAVVRGSGVLVPGERVRQGDGTGGGKAMICIADGELVAGFSDGQVSRLSAGRYRTAVTEVCATFREVDGIPQYIAIPQ